MIRYSLWQSLSLLSRRSNSSPAIASLITTHPCTLQQLIIPQHGSKKTYSGMASGLGIRRPNTLPFPKIETIYELNTQTLVESNFRTVKYGDHEYRECLDGFVQVYCHACGNEREHNKCASYVLVYAEGHPLNMCGAVEHRQGLNHAILYSILQALKNIPENSYKKVCICVPESRVISFICKGIPALSENSYRSVRTGRLNKDLETSMEINNILRTRQDITFRMKFIPRGVSYRLELVARNWAHAVSEDLTLQKKRKESRIPNLLDMFP